jgi:hypothetical protein
MRVVLFCLLTVEVDRRCGVYPDENEGKVRPGNARRFTMTFVDRLID